MTSTDNQPGAAVAAAPATVYNLPAATTIEGGKVTTYARLVGRAHAPGTLVRLANRKNREARIDLPNLTYRVEDMAHILYRNLPSEAKSDVKRTMHGLQPKGEMPYQRLVLTVAQ